MEDRILKTKLGSLELAEKRLLKRYRSETRLLKIKQEQRLGNLAIKRNEANGSNSNKRSPSPQSMGISCQLDLTKLQFTCDKRQSDNNSCSTNDGLPQPSSRLPRLPSVDSTKSPEPLTPTSKDSCQLSVNQKAIWTPPIVLQEGLTSVESKPGLLRDRDGIKCILGSNNDNPGMSFITESPRKRSASPRARSQTWNGKPLPNVQLSQSVTERNRSYSDEVKPRINRQTSLPCDLAVNIPNDISYVHIDHQKGETLLANDLKTSCPNQEIKLDEFFEILESLPPLFEDESCKPARINNEADEVTNEGAAGGICPLPVSGNPTQQCPVYPSGPVCSGPICLLPPRRRQRISMTKGNVMEDSSCNNTPNIPMESSVKSSRAGESGYGAVRKASVKCKNIHNANEQGQLTNQETTVLKKTSVKREKLTARSKSLSSSLGKCSLREEIGVDFPKRKESVKSKHKPVLDDDLENKADNNIDVPIDKSNWMKALKKVFNVNLFLSGMVALQKQRELDRVALEKKKAALDKLYQDLQHCRYLRQPSKEDNEHTDYVSWVFDKD
ncbi:hypothetical protein OS493_014013 [Desmophyllum pertusum]|uniref:Uncharacterized protein n=1 Tax=Desmophyllum pertusum TaxID=174260 RepID=A0A9X0CZ10_9CNID|nr:hypothetical protein OS493_014013 [Desmophyllum pertusum]